MIAGASMLALRRSCWPAGTDYDAWPSPDGALGCSAKYDLAAATLYGVGIPTLAVASFWLGATKRKGPQLSWFPRVGSDYGGMHLSGRL